MATAQYNGPTSGNNLAFSHTFTHASRSAAATKAANRKKFSSCIAMVINGLE
jgi:hypothetical protein